MASSLSLIKAGGEGPIIRVDCLDDLILYVLLQFSLDIKYLLHFVRLTLHVKDSLDNIDFCRKAYLISYFKSNIRATYWQIHYCINRISPP